MAMVFSFLDRRLHCEFIINHSKQFIILPSNQLQQIHWQMVQVKWNALLMEKHKWQLKRLLREGAFSLHEDVSIVNEVRHLTF